MKILASNLKMKIELSFTKVRKRPSLTTEAEVQQQINQGEECLVDCTEYSMYQYLSSGQVTYAHKWYTQLVVLKNQSEHLETKSAEVMVFL